MKESYFAPRKLSDEEVRFVTKYLMRKYSKLKYFWHLYYKFFNLKLPKDLTKRMILEASISGKEEA